METEIVTARLRLRRARPEDLDALHALVSDWEVVKQTATWPWPPDRAFTETRAQPMPAGRGIGGPVFADGELVGMVGVNATDTCPQLGYMFARAQWGRGFASEIGRALIAHAFATYDWPSIGAGVFEENPASVRVLVKLGFDETGRCAGPSLAQGRALPMRIFRLERWGAVSSKETGPKSSKDFGAT